MNDSDLADVLIDRLNKLIEDPAVREDVGRLIETRVPCSDATLKHPTIQAQEGAPDSMGTVGFLGVLNGIVGARWARGACADGATSWRSSTTRRSSNGSGARTRRPRREHERDTG